MQVSALVKLFAALVAAASPAVAELAVTAPTASTTCQAGQTCTITWNDNGQGVTLAQQGRCTVALYTGNQQQQTFLQPIAFPNPINVATTAAIEWIPDATVGPNDNRYFIRFESQDLNQNGTGVSNRPYLSFSAKFTLSGMTGTFNSTVEQQLAGITSTGGATPTPGGSSTRAPSSTGRASSTTSASRTNTTGAASPNAGASTLVAAGALFAGVVALF